MKKFFALFFVLLALASTAYAVPYATIFEVYSIDTKENITIFIDSSGFLWEWEESEEWEEGDLFTALMESNDTLTVEDDIITEIYSKEEYFYPDEEWEEIPILFLL